MERQCPLALLKDVARLERFERVRELHNKGWPLRAIGRELGLKRGTVRKFLRAPAFPERQPRVLRQPGVLEPFVPYLVEHWNAGCRNGTVLWKELGERGSTRELVVNCHPTIVGHLRVQAGTITWTSSG